MLKLPPVDKLFVEVVDLMGEPIKWVAAADPDEGILIKYCDFRENGFLNSFRTERLYTKDFHIVSCR